MQLPGPVRAFVGLLAVTAEEAKHLPDRAIELPMLAVSSALQASLRAQQRYARLAARGDDVINRRQPSDEPPAWATFDDPVAPEELQATGLDDADPAERARAASQLLDELLGGVGGSGATAELRPVPSPRPEAKRSTAAAKKRPATKKAPARKSTAKKAAAKRAPSKSSDDADTATKAINAPRHTAPSRFDTVEDD